MSNIVYLKLIGEQQGDISDGCGTIASVGNRWQQNYVNEIFVFFFGGRGKEYRQRYEPTGINIQ